MNRHSLLMGGLLALLLLSACQPSPSPTLLPSPDVTEEEEPTVAVEPSVAPTLPPEPIVARINLERSPVSIDPTLVAAGDAVGNDLVEAFFVGLTQVDLDTGEILPMLATEWEATDRDGLIWEISLRDDVYWVSIDADTNEFVQQRRVIADDVLAAITRACRADSGAPLFQGALIIAGCREVRASNPATLTDEDIVATLGVSILAESSLEIRLAEPVGYLPSVLAMPLLRPIPHDQVGPDWTLPANLWVSGAFVPQPTIAPQEGYRLLANPFWPFERMGNIDVLEVSFGRPDDAFGAFMNGELDLAPIPPGEINPGFFASNGAYQRVARPVTTILIPQAEVPPFDDPQIGLALSLAIDRAALIEQVLEAEGQGTGLPAVQIAPPGTPALQVFDESGYDPEQARILLREGGYNNCLGLPPTTILIDETPLSRRIAEVLRDMWLAELNCVERFRIEERPFSEVQDTLLAPPPLFSFPRPGLAVLNWQADILDAHHWYADVFGCQALFPSAYLDQSRPCTEVDELVMTAARTPDQDARFDLYDQIQADMFGSSGEMPVIPLYHFARPLAAEDGITLPPGGPLRFVEWTLSP
ncbi:MAG: hypothetical protein GYB68_14610 [Chloroflexi bacterium]|nr:hypothetical protein [Chloroflexota bacterium]